MNLARRAHQPPGRLVDEDSFGGLPLAQRAVQGQGGVPTPVWELVHLEEPLHCRRQSEDGSRHRSTRQVSSPTVRVDDAKLGILVVRAHCMSSALKLHTPAAVCRTDFVIELKQ